MRLIDFDAEAFLRDYWQKKPMLIKNPWGVWNNPLAPDELAGLACENTVESRLIVQTDGNMTVENGPLAEARFATLGTNPWTLLVQAVDTHVAEVAALIDPFRFIPNWRIDDVMVSYATDDGGVGAHFDQYDVFLIQGLGTRRWQVGGLCDAQTALLPHDDLRLLSAFDVAAEWLLEPGDILYVPPRIAHNGIAVGDDCMTYSIGFRAPSRGELIADYADDLVGDIDEDDRYADPDLAAQQNPGEITGVALDRLHAMITQKLADRAAFARWFGGYTSSPKYPEIDFAPDKPITRESAAALIAAAIPLIRNPASRFAFISQGENAVQLVVDGKCHDCAGRVAVFAQNLCASDHVEISPQFVQAGEVVELIVMLCNQGSIAFDDDD